MNLSKLTMPKIKELKEVLNLTEDEEIVFDMLAKSKSIIDISLKMQLSESTVNRRIKAIKFKIDQIGGISWL